MLNSIKFDEYNYNNLGVIFTQGDTVDGTVIKIKSISSLLKIKNYSKEVVIESLVSGNEENLIGFNFLLDIVTTFDGPNNLLKLVKNSL